MPSLFRRPAILSASPAGATMVQPVAALIASLPPTRLTTRSSSARSSLGCMSSGSSPSSSRNTVPPRAASNPPTRAAVAPVNAPRSWPNSSLSIKVGGIDPQSSTTNGPRARGLASWSASASRPLPVPVSPSSSTLASDSASLGSTAKIRRIASLAPSARPHRGSADSGARSSPPWASNRIRVAPTPITAPGARYARSIATPLIVVPLVLPRSRTSTPRGAGRIARWWRDTAGSLSTSALAGAVPIDTSAAPPSWTRSRSGPSMTVSRNRGNRSSRASATAVTQGAPRLAESVMVQSYRGRRGDAMAALESRRDSGHPGAR